MAEDHEAVIRRSIDEVWNGGRLEVVDELVAAEYVRYESTLPRVVRGPPSSRRPSASTAAPSPTSTW